MCLSKRPLSEALPGAALNKDELNKAGGLGRGRGGRSKGSSGTPCLATDPRTLAAGSGAQGGRKGSSYRHVRSLQPSASCDRQQDSCLCAASPRTGATTTRSAKRCRLGERGGFTPRLHPLLYLKASLEANSARHAAQLAVGLQSDCCHLRVGSSLHAGKERSSQHPSCARCSSSQAGPMIPSLRGLPSVTPDHSGMLSGRKTPGSPSVWQDAPEVWEQIKRCAAVLS